MNIPIWVGYSIKFEDFKIFFLFALPFFLPYSFGQVSAILEKTLVSTIGVGYVSALDYSRKFTDIFVSVLTSVLVTMLVPALSSSFIDRKPREFATNFIQIFQLGMLLLSFVIPVFTATSLDIIQVFFDKGKIPQQTLLEISQLTILYGWSTLAVFVYLIFGMALLSSGRGKKYAFYGMLAQIISIIINLALVKSIGIYIFPISLLLSHTISGLIMAYEFPYKTKLLFKVFFKYNMILVLTTSMVYFSNKIIQLKIDPIFQVICYSALTFVILLSFVFLFNLDEKKTISIYYAKFKGH